MGRFVTISEEKLTKMALAFWDERTPTSTVGMGVEFAQEVLREYERIRAIENSRMGCLVNGGHEIRFSGGPVLGEMTYENGGVLVRGMSGLPAYCLNCDAMLTITYREET